MSATWAHEAQGTTQFRATGFTALPTIMLDAVALLVLLLAYSQLLTYEFAYHLDYYSLTNPYQSNPHNRMYEGFPQFFFVFPEAPYLIRIGRLLNALLVSLQTHLVDSVEAFRYARIFYFFVLIAVYLWMSRILVRHFRLSPVAARVLTLLFALSPPMQQAVFMSTFSAPLFVAFGAATASYLKFAELFTKPNDDPRPVFRIRVAVASLLLIVSLSCYSPMAMFFVTLALLELIVGFRVGPNAPYSAFQFTARTIVFLFVTIGLYFLIDRAIYYLLFADNPAILLTRPTRFYSLTLNFLTIIEGLGNRLENFWICYHNAAGLWDQETHASTLMVVTILAFAGVVQASVRVGLKLMRHPRLLGAPWRAYGRRVALSDACKFVLFVLTVLPFLVPDTKADWANGYRDSFRTLPAIEAALLFLCYDFLRQLPFNAVASGAASGAWRIGSALAIWRTVAGAATASLVLAAALLAYRHMDVGSRWANAQLQFYLALSDYLTQERAAELVTPCGNGDTWIWLSPSIRGEYAYTGINWNIYIRHTMAPDGASKAIKFTCGWANTEYHGPYLARGGDLAYIDYRRFIADYAPFVSSQYFLPFQRQEVLFPDITKAEGPSRPRG